MDGLSGYPSRWILLGMLTALRGTWTFFVCVIRVYPVTQPSSDIFLDGYPPVKALDTTRITQCPSLTSRDYYQEKKNLPTIFRLGARAIGTCLVLLAAAWQSISKWAN